MFFCLTKTSVWPEASAEIRPCAVVLPGGLVGCVCVWVVWLLFFVVCCVFLSCVLLCLVVLWFVLVWFDLVSFVWFGLAWFVFLFCFVGCVVVFRLFVLFGLFCFVCLFALFVCCVVSWFGGFGVLSHTRSSWPVGCKSKPGPSQETAHGVSLFECLARL